MGTVSVKYDLLWQFKNNPKYKFTSCRKCFNTNTDRQIKMVLNGGSIGFWIASKFYPLSKINQHLEKIVYEKLPF